MFIHYVTDSKEIMAKAGGLRKGNRIWVFLTYGKMSDIDKRDAQIASFYSSLKVPGMIEEDLSKKPVKPIKANEAQFEQFVLKAMQKIDVPGVAIAIVENGKIVFAKGFGVKERGKDDKVDSQTTMKIGSISKSLTTLLMAKLIDEGKFAWNTKVRTLYPNFHVADEKLSNELEMQYLTCACTGIPRKDLVMLFNVHNPDVFKQIAQFKQTTGFGETFQYQNQFLTAAGYVSSYAVDPQKPMDEGYCALMQEKIFAPMGMTNTSFVPGTNYAMPHSFTTDGITIPITVEQDRFTDFTKPAGGIWSNVMDMAQYMITELNEGVNAKGERVVSAENLMYRRKQFIKRGA